MTCDKPLYFRHIPKTAGSSVRIWLFESFDPQSLCQKGMADQFFLDPTFSPDKYSIYSTHCHGYLDQILMRETFQFTVLRNPIQRTYSHWREICRSDYHPHHSRVIKQTYEQFILDVANEVFIRNFQARYLCFPRIDILETASTMSKAQLEQFQLSQLLEEVSLEWTDEQVSGQCRVSLSRMIAVGVADRLGQFLGDLSHKLDVERPAAMPTVNVLSGGVTETLSAEALKRLNRLTEIDAEIYGSCL